MQIKLADVNKVRIFTSVTTTNTHNELLRTHNNT